MSRFWNSLGRFVVILPLLTAADWLSWRGPSHNGHISESSGWDGKKWPLTEQWRINIGEGCSAPIVIGDTIYTMGREARNDTVLALDRATGKILWTQKYPAPRYGRHARGDQSFFSGPLGSPQYDPKTKFLFTLGCDGHLRCWDTTQQGQLIWKHDLYDEYTIPVRPPVTRPTHRDYGFTSSPLLHDDQLIVEVGAKEGSIIAFDCQTGKERWRSEAKTPAGHNGGPVPITVENQLCFATLNHEGLLVVRGDGAQAGATVATYPWKTTFANNIASPTVVGSDILLTSNYNIRKTARIHVTLQGAEKVWESRLYSKVCSPIVLGEHVYFVWSALVCLDWKTGATVWRKTGYADVGSGLATSDGRLIFYTGRGDLTLVESAKRSPDDCTILASHGPLFKADAWPHVVLSQGSLFCRDKKGNFVCLKLPSVK